MTSESESRAPYAITKQLKLNQVGERRKVRISTNFLQHMNFNPGDRVIAIPSADGGFNVRLSDEGPQKVHSRAYNRARQNNPTESLLEFSSEDLMSNFPPSMERFHVRMTRGEVRVRPIPNRVFNITRRFEGRDPFRAMVGMTGGVDIACLEQAGISTDVVLEYRPQEARDTKSGRNLTEVHALNTLVNGQPRVLINEDIYQADPRWVRQLCEEAGCDVIGLAHWSAQCDDMSNAKAKSLKEKSIANNTTTVDMVVPIINHTQAMEPAVVLVENVPGFRHHSAGVILKSMLTRMGYHCGPGEMVLNARDYGGIQNRTRYYLVASIWPGYQPPTPVERNTQPIWPIVEKHLADCRDVTDCKFIVEREASGRGVPFITRDSTFCSTILKSQNRGIKDGQYLEHEGRILAPSEGLIQELMGIPESFDVSWMAKEQAIETMGQSLDFRLHHAVIESVRRHIEENVGQAPIARRRFQSRAA